MKPKQPTNHTLNSFAYTEIDDNSAVGYPTGTKSAGFRPPAWSISRI